MFLLPNIATVPRHFESGSTWEDLIFRYGGKYPVVMGMAGGFYCYMCALLLGGMGRSLILVRQASSHPR